MAQKQKNALRAAETIRTKLIKRINSCTSNDELLSILDKYKVDKKNGLYTVNLGNFKPSQRTKIENLNEKIEELIQEKTDQFAPKTTSHNVEVDFDEEYSDQENTDIELPVESVSSSFTVRVDLIKSLTESPLDETLQNIIIKYDDDRADHLFDVSMENHSSNQKVELTKLDGIIKKLINEKKSQFNTEPVISEVPVILPTNISDPIPSEPIGFINTPEIKKRDLQRVANLKAVFEQLEQLSDKSAEFSGKIKDLREKHPEDTQKLEDYRKAQYAIDCIRINITTLYDQYTYGDIELNQFKTQAKPYLHEENDHVQTLQSHRGIKQILTNLLAAILSIGIVYGIAAVARKTFFPFNPATDSSIKLNKLDELIEEAVASPAA